MAYTVSQKIWNLRGEGRTYLSTRGIIQTIWQPEIRGQLERRFHTMTQRTTAEIGFVRFSDSDLVFENPEQDIREHPIGSELDSSLKRIRDLKNHSEICSFTPIALA
jgi:hypothetical protein